ncbi:MAG: dTMP kinase [Desulfobacteraceae bacterium]|nr:dTMP kinase [Desulfobacteraceae bacterium]MBC2757342.1 dTMP kinase [Desulfobacteraceae bacterium]MBC2763944.1 dTMP kinase [ANME-2 cluster archaeon]
MLITLEGIEGSGKTTQIDYIAAYLQKFGLEYIITKEPGGTVLGEKIRSILLDPGNNNIHPLTELLLYAADRVQHIKELISPMIESGKIVICDRFCDSTTVYQGFTRGVDIRLIQQLNSLVLEGLKPDITFILDLDPEIGLKRAWKQIKDGSRAESETRFENERLQFHESVRNGYLELARQEPNRFVVVDASMDPSKVSEQMLKHLEKCLMAL